MISADHFADLVDRRDLEVVRWIRRHGFEFPESMLDAATELGNLELVQFLYEHGGRTSGGCLRQAMGLAAEFGHLGVIEYLFENNPEAFASGRGPNRHHMYTLGYTHESEDGAYEPYFVLAAAQNGHLDCIKFAHEHDFERNFFH